MSSRSRRRCCGTAWRSASPAAPRASRVGAADREDGGAAPVSSGRARDLAVSACAPPGAARRCASAPSRPPRRCRRCWSRPSGSPRRWRRACTAGAGSDRARRSGSSASTSPAMPPPASTGARAPSRSASMSAKPNGKRRRACGCGATRRRRWITARPGYISGGDWPTKRDRAELILVALASLLVRGGERLTLLGSGIAPMTGRVALTRLVEMIENRPGGGKAEPGLPAFEPLPRAGQLVLIGGFSGAARTRSGRGRAVCRRRAERASAADRRPGRGGSAVRRPGPLRGGRGARGDRDQPGRERARGLCRGASAGIARASPILPARSAGRSAITAPIARRTWRCWRCTRRCRRTAGGDSLTGCRPIDPPPSPVRGRAPLAGGGAVRLRRYGHSDARPRFARFRRAVAADGAGRAAGDLVAAAGHAAGAAP